MGHMRVSRPTPIPQRETTSLCKARRTIQHESFSLAAGLTEGPTAHTETTQAEKKGRTTSALGKNDRQGTYTAVLGFSGKTMQ